MKISDFKLERYFAKYEFQTKYLFSSSDCDGFSQSYVLDHADNEELKLWENLKLGYTESEGHPLLRESISKFYQITGSENILVLSPGEANFILMNTLLEKSDHVICIAPAYQSLYQVVKSVGCEISYWQPNPADWRFDPEELQNLVKPNTKLVIINFPHNPTGAYPTKTELDRVIEICRKNNLYLFSDEMYRLLTSPGVEDLPAACDLYEKAISLWGMAKTFGLAGLRIGWLATQDKSILNKIVAFKDYLTICNNAPSEVLSIIALNHYKNFVEHNKEKISKNVQLFEEFTNQTSTVKYNPIQAGSTAFVKLNIPETSFEFSEKFVKEKGVMTVPAKMFEYDGSFIRVGFGRKNFPEVLNIFSDYLDKNY